MTPRNVVTVSFFSLLSRTFATGPLAHTTNGTYEGLSLPSYSQDLFLGVPYAQPPTGPLRFQPAQSLNATFDTHQATSYSSECYGYGSDQFGYSVSEDCLYLSITRPSSTSADSYTPPNATANDTNGLPVAVWIHGGGYSQGGSADRRYNTSFIVENSVSQNQPIIAVSIQYRLSAWGLLYSEQVAGAGLANLALRDQRKALHWLQENIAAFGGDPEKVSIWGESAGGSSVGFHLLAYNGRDDGLFRGAVMESGNPVPYRGLNGTGYYQPHYDNLTASVKPGAGFSQQGLDSCAEATDSLDCLRYVDMASLNEAINTTFATAWFPVVDGEFIAEFPSRQMERGAFVKVPIISGANTDEGTSFAPEGINNTADFRRLVSDSPSLSSQPGIPLPAPLTNQILAAYPNSPCTDLPQDGPGNVNASGVGDCSVPTPAEGGAQYKRAVTYSGDAVFIAERRRTCRTWAANDVPAYCYRFNTVPANQTSVTHFQEVAFVFDNTQGLGYPPLNVAPFQDKPPTYTALATTMSRSWASFFSTLDPNAWRTSAPVPEGASGGPPGVWEEYGVGMRDIVRSCSSTARGYELIGFLRFGTQMLRVMLKLTIGGAA
ncbi:MAG: hypothetical protein Q9162_004815 [Coniocarpon cinnabarinum]